ncbi:hypothetical protein BO94DRAFT_623130 [Aspergillus sclerotioniger CBS 115572]|uniref:Rhodopsin domain-containing protein n=1 Tax=Aspergillus sclerotioniger CBS 115572 TaxID=1450535 RepID=A0A317WVD8_9EURO|nr:hypothetical protein BO94DRAFT_623130 [Aspergillus sclerotioniger CBS 115572]PWY90326.1 hypothetical protein BO94DRAFT_623130 [Aspergillus sclerotioniger CBS 115572]
MEVATGVSVVNAASEGDLAHPWLRTTNQVLAAAGMALCVGLLTMRIYTKVRIMGKFWWDDICLILAWVFSVGTQAVILYGYNHAGYGVHMWHLTAPVLELYAKTILAGTIIYLPALATAKFALLMLYYRLVSMIRVCKYIIYLVTFIIAGYTIAITLSLIFACRPIAKNWDVSITTGHCIKRTGFYLATAITNTISDVMLILIPIPIVCRLRLPLAQKLGIGCMFGIGCLTIITSILRLATLMPLVTSKDQSYKIAVAIIFVIIEANFIIICGCLPYLKQFLRFHAPRWIGDSSGSSEYRDQESSHSTPSSKRRKPGLSVLQDDIERALTQPEEAHCACVLGGRYTSSDEMQELIRRPS